MRISVIVPFGRVEGFLPELIASLKQQTYQPYELVIADPHYPDRQAYIASFEASFPIVYARVPRSAGHRDHLRCRNAGAAASVGEALVFFDDDEIIADELVLARYAEAFETLPLVKGYYRFFNDLIIEDGIARGIVDGTGTVQVDDGPGIYPYHTLYGGNFGIRRDLFYAIGGFDEAYDGGPIFTKSDVDLSLRACRAARLAHLTCPDGIAILHPTSVYIDKYGKERFAYRPKHWLCPNHSREHPYEDGQVDIIPFEGLYRYQCHDCPATGPTDCIALIRKLMRERDRVRPLMPYQALAGCERG